MPRIYKRPPLDDLRCLILDGLVWIAKIEFLSDGVKTRTLDPSELSPASIEDDAPVLNPTKNPKLWLNAAIVSDSTIEIIQG